MKLSGLLTALGNSQNLKITLLNSNDIKLIEFFASGYALIESDLANKEVKRIKIITATDVYISVEDNDEPEEPIIDPEPTTEEPTDSENKPDESNSDPVEPTDGE